MRIVSFNDMLSDKIPVGTVFMTYDRTGDYGQLQVKHKDTGIDLYFYAFEIDNNGSEQYFDRILKMEENRSLTYPLRVFSTREGMFDEAQKYMILDDEDVVHLMGMLSLSLMGEEL